MNRSEYLSRPTVRSFIEWLAPRLDMADCFCHTYVRKRPKGEVWQCNSIYAAFENYNWSFTCSHIANNRKVKGNTFAESKALLDELSVGLKKSISQGNPEACQQYCLAILDWGGVLPRNKDKILALGTHLTTYLEKACEQLNPETFNTTGEYGDIIMNAGFTKIYSLLIDNFVIYDGRVGAALGLLVRHYCEEKKVSAIPNELLFAYGNAKGDTYGLLSRRNPGTEQYKFPVLNNVYKKHTDNNLRANWLLAEVLDRSNSLFNTLPTNVRLRALEAALFMIGYSVA